MTLTVWFVTYDLRRQRLTSKSFNCVMHKVALAPVHSVIDTLRRQESHNAQMDGNKKQ
jgi:hypothetical protein